ncbi:hypothetical protein K450DRAFT_251522 [Umbelopsis ramanniana AG]|uniref:Uncharacterized protein n=1 Tax=Umbelopsis ramanniana AG TaxID=1314678 RepID=A0AAD5E6C1_UMBRA|nr:uncharacterized protein K450DRAFT_251522 [Umbelopsis ramanniana AG]KAI8577584.1 hypothetical protein K450DRAFT_251522 [Umbelopsis ramanniana AG]
MNILLKSDVEGVLEHVATNNHSGDPDQISHTVISLLAQEVEHTRQRLDGVSFEQELHKVLFRAWQQNTGSYRPYAKFHHRNGLKTIEYYQLLNKFNLWQQLAVTVYTLPPELAIDILETLGGICLKDDSDNAYIAIYLIVCANLPVRQRIEKCETTIMTFLQRSFNAYISSALLTLLKSLIVGMTTATASSDVTKPIPDILQNLLNQLMKASANNDSMQTPHSQPWQKLFWMRLRQLIDSSKDCRLMDIHKICEEELQKLQTTYKNKQCISLTKQDFTKFRDNSSTDPAKEHQIANKHLASFILIYKKIAMNCPFDNFVIDAIPGSTNENGVTTKTYSQRHPFSFHAESHSTLGHCVEECLYRIRNHLPGWKSFLELAVDYQDVVFSYIEPGSQIWHEICTAIASEKLYWKFFERLVYIIKIHLQTDDLIESDEIQALCEVFMAVFNSITDLEERFNFRNQVHYSSRNEDSESLYILFETFSVWSRSTLLAYENELKIVCNQIVEVSETGEVDETSEHHTDRLIIEKLCTISVVMPYSVVSHLVMNCIRNRGQTTAIGHILQMSGGICSLITGPDNSTLLIDVLSSDEVIRMLETPTSRRNYVDLVCQWAKLSTATQPHTNGQALLDLVPYYQFCLIPELSKAITSTSVRAAALPAFIQLISITLGMHFEEGNQDRDSMKSGFDAVQLQNNQGGHARKYYAADLLKRLNWVQILAYLAMLLSTRAHNLDKPSSDKDTLHVHMKFVDWEACIFALEALVTISEDYINERDQKPKRSKETLLTLTDMAGSIDTLIDKSSCFCWDLQLRLYPFFSNVAQGLASDTPSMTLPNHLKEFLEGFGGPIVYYDGGSDESNKWTQLMMACKSTSYIHSTVIKKLSSSTIYTTGKLHPDRSVHFATGMYQALLPSRTMSVLSEYKRLLIDFLGKLFDLPNIPEMVRNYDYDSEYMNRMVKDLEHEDLRALHSIMYSKLLLSTSTLLSNQSDNSEGNTSAASAKDSNDNHVTYFVASIMRVIQSLRNWSDILADNRLQVAELQRQPFSDYLRQVMPELHNLPPEPSFQSRSEDKLGHNGTDALDDAINMYIAMSNEQQDVQMTAHQPRELMFPPYSPTMVSYVNLSVITLNLLAHAKALLKDEKLRETIWILMSHIIEGICNDPQRKRLIQAARKAGKATIKNWKKRTDDHKYIVKCRPLLSPDQQALTRDTLTVLDSEQERQVISDKLDLSGSSNAKAPSYYF